MRNAADAYRQSDPDFNKHFKRGYRWSDLPARACPKSPTLDDLAAAVMLAWRADAVRA